MAVNHCSSTFAFTNCTTKNNAVQNTATPAFHNTVQGVRYIHRAANTTTAESGPICAPSHKMGRYTGATGAARPSWMSDTSYIAYFDLTLGCSRPRRPEPFSAT